jgi:TRAP-type C4-dicarboxylate transport system permease large subunit
LWRSFVIFGAVLNAGEAGQGFMNVAAAAAGRLTAGAAKVSVLSSALFGSISGSASANVASTGCGHAAGDDAKLGYPETAGRLRRRRWPPPAARSCRR